LNELRDGVFGYKYLQFSFLHDLSAVLWRCNKWSVPWEQENRKERELVLLFRFFVVEDKNKVECNNKKSDLSMKFSRYRFKLFFIVSLFCARTFCAAAFGGAGNCCWWKHDLRRNSEFLWCSLRARLPAH